MNTMKLEYKLNTAVARTLREEEITCREKAHRTRSNYPHWQTARAMAYAARMDLRLEQRYLHLARAYLKDMPYNRVEQDVREGNEPKVKGICTVLHSFGYSVEPVWVELWLK